MNPDERKRRNRKRRNRRNRKKRMQRNLILGGMVLLLLLFGIVMMRIFSKEPAESKKEEPKKSVKVKEEKQEAVSEAVIKLVDADVTLKLGDEFAEPGFSAEDKDGNDLTGQVEVDKSALNRAGVQKIIYSVQDNKGRKAIAEREIEILPNTEYGASGLPICMYHYVYDKNNPPEKIDSNFITTEALAEEMKYLKDNNYYFPTWQEVRDYVEGKLLLPEKSIVITFDDGPNFMELGIPVLEQYQVPATSFVITSYWDSKEMLDAYKSEYLTFESHSHKMHQGGGKSGHGGIYTAMSREEILADLQQSFAICTNKNAFAYPFGDYTEEGCSVLEEAGLLCAVTTENAKCYPGDNPMKLSRVRMLGAQSLDSFVSAIK